MPTRPRIPLLFVVLFSDGSSIVPRGPGSGCRIDFGQRKAIEKKMMMTRRKKKKKEEGLEGVRARNLLDGVLACTLRHGGLIMLQTFRWRHDTWI